MAEEKQAVRQHKREEEGCTAGEEGWIVGAAEDVCGSYSIEEGGL